MSECFAPTPRLIFCYLLTTGLLVYKKPWLAADFEADVADGLLVWEKSLFAPGSFKKPGFLEKPGFCWENKLVFQGRSLLTINNFSVVFNTILSPFFQG